MSETKSGSLITVRMILEAEYTANVPDELFDRLQRLQEYIEQSGFGFSVSQALTLHINGKPVDLQDYLKEVEGKTECLSQQIFGGTPPMSFQEAKTALFPHIEKL